MKDADKTREHLKNELAELRRRIADLEASETERKQAEKALRLQSEIAVNMAEGVYLVGLDDVVIRYANPKFEEMFGYEPGEIVGKHASIINAPTDKSPEERAKEIMEVIYRTGKWHGEVNNIKKDGTPFWCYANVSVFEHPEYGKVLVAVHTDITERKQAEEREKRLQQELYLSSRLAAIGQLAAGVAHEINNPLTGIMGYSERLLRKPADEKTKKGLEIIHSSSLRAAKIVQNLLTFARRHQPKKEYADINEIVKEALELRAYELKASNIEAALVLASDLPQIMGDFHQLQEVFLNLILNAEQAMTEAHRGGKLIIKTKQLKNHVRISFADDGPGIPHQILDKLFDPFFSTREEKGGTGLGLSICHGIITEHEGKIYAKSKLGKGTTFFVELPMVT